MIDDSFSHLRPATWASALAEHWNVSERFAKCIGIYCFFFFFKTHLQETAAPLDDKALYWKRFPSVKRKEIVSHDGNRLIRGQVARGWVLQVCLCILKREEEAIYKKKKKKAQVDVLYRFEIPVHLLSKCYTGDTLMLRSTQSSAIGPVMLRK